MKRTRTELKTRAKRALLGNYGIAVGALILIQIICMVFIIPLYIVFIFMAMSSVESMFHIGGAVAFIIIWYFVFLFAAVFINCGYSRLVYQICVTGRGAIGDLLYPFGNHPFRFIGVWLFQMLIGFLSSIPGIVVMIIGNILISGAVGVILSILGYFLIMGLSLFVTLPYAMSNWVLIDNPDYKVGEALRMSKHLMEGNKGRYFVMYLSFIGIGLLTMLSFGLGSLWVTPYVSATFVFFFLDMKEEKYPAIQSDIVPDVMSENEFNYGQEPTNWQ